MAEVEYGPLSAAGGYRATVSNTPGYGMGGGGIDDLGWLAAAARRRAEQKLHLGELEGYAAEDALNRSRRPAPAKPALQSGPSYEDRKRQQLELRDLEAQVHARTTGAPVVGITAPYAAGVRYELDPLQMNAYQRQLYMPQNNQMIGGGGPSPASLPPPDMAQPGGGGGSDLSSYLNALRMYQPDQYAAVVSGSLGRK